MSTRALQSSHFLRLRIAWIAAGGLTFLAAAPSFAESEIPRSDRPDAARVYFISPADGAVVSSPFVIRFGLATGRASANKAENCRC